MNIKEFITSGILEGYVLNTVSDEDRITVERLADQYREVRAELSLIEESFKLFSEEHSLSPPLNLKDKIIAKIQENLLQPPILNSNSKIVDYQPWLDRVKAPESYDNLHMEVIGDYQNAKVVIAWIRNGETNHSHDQYTENFLIVEGTCTAVINGKTANYGVGDFVSFPIHLDHSYEITSKKPMKVVACLDFKGA